MKVSLISTVKDAAPFVGDFLASVKAQTRPPDEVIICDGGSTDGTVGILRSADGVIVVEEAGANISRGRILAVREAAGDVIAVSDADCVLDPRWLEGLVTAIEDGADVAMGAYRAIPRNFFEACSAATHVPDPHELREDSFMPSSRSVAFRREAYEKAGGYPDWLEVGEDMWLDHRFREMGADMRLVREAIVSWRPRPTLASTWRQYGGYARGDALAGMYPKRHAMRFAAYGGALLLARRRWGLALLAMGGIAYATRPVERAFRLLDDPGDRAAAVVAVPALIAVADLAKMWGYVSGQLRRRWAND